MPLRNINAVISFWMTSWKESLLSHQMGLHGNILLNIARAQELMPAIVTAWPQAHKLTSPQAHKLKSSQARPPTDRPRRRRCRCRLRRQLAAASAGASLPSWEQPVKSVKSGEEQPSWVCDPGRRGEGQVASRSFGKLGVGRLHKCGSSPEWRKLRVQTAAARQQPGSVVGAGALLGAGRPGGRGEEDVHPGQGHKVQGPHHQRHHARRPVLRRGPHLVSSKQLPA